MASCQEFEVTVHTSPGPTCGTFNRLRLSVIGSQGETPPTTVTKGNTELLCGSVSSTFTAGPGATFSFFCLSPHIVTGVSSPARDQWSSRSSSSGATPPGGSESVSRPGLALQPRGGPQAAGTIRAWRSRNAGVPVRQVAANSRRRRGAAERRT